MQREKADSIFHSCSSRCYLSGLWQQGEAAAPAASHSLCRPRFRCTNRLDHFWETASMLLASIEMANCSDGKCWALQQDPERRYSSITFCQGRAVSPSSAAKDLRICQTQAKRSSTGSAAACRVLWGILLLCGCVGIHIFDFVMEESIHFEFNFILFRIKFRM